MKRNVTDKRLLLNDEPIETEDMDEFRHSSFVDVLFDLVKDINEPCNVGLFGKWGTGKTSIVKMLFNRIRNDKILSEITKCVYFDAWKYSDDSLGTQLLLELDEKLGRPLGKNAIIDDLYNIQEEEVREKPKTVSSRIRGFFLNLKVFWIFAVGIMITDFLVFFLTDIEIANIVTASVIVPLVAELISKMSILCISVKKRIILPKKEWAGEFENLFRKIVSSSEAKKIIIAIDNLDRCQSQTVVQTLALLKTFMDIPKCIYIVPCDEEAVLNHITTIDKGGGHFTRNGQEFLRKVFQVTIKIPPFLSESLEEYAQTLRSQLQVPFDENVQDVIVSAHVNNPRRIIHAFNRLTTMYLLAKKKEENNLIKKGVITNNLPFLAKIAIIEEEWKDFYEDLSNNILLLNEVESYLKGTSGKGVSENIQRYFEQSPELEGFLNATTTIQVDDVKPFLLLSQGMYESTIPELELLKTCAIKNDVNRARDILTKTPNNEKLNYVKVILGWCEDYVHSRHYNFGFNCLNIVSHIYDTLPDEYHSEVAKKFGNYLDRGGIRESLLLFNIGRLFEILPHMPEITRDDILCNLISSFFSGDCKNDAILLKLVERSDLVGPESKRKLNDYLLELLTPQFEIIKNIIQVISQNEAARENLLEKEFFCKYIETLEVRGRGGLPDKVIRFHTAKGTPQQKPSGKSIPRKLSIRVKLLFGSLEETVVQVSSNATFGELLEKVAQKMQLDPQDNTIVIEGMKISPDMLLSERDIKDGDVVGVINEPPFPNG